MYSTSRVVAAGAVLVLAAAACGSSGGSGSGASGSSLHAVQTAYQSTLDAKTAKVSFTESTQAHSSTGSSQTTTVTGSGVVDFPGHSFQLHVNAPSGGSIDVIETGGVAYTQVPAVARSQVPGHKPWVSVNLNKVSQAKLGASFSQLASLGSADPTKVLANLGQVSDHVTQAGTASIDGTNTTGYQAQVDLDKVAAQARAKAGPKAAQAIQQEEQSLGTHTLPVEVWVDPHGLIRRLSTQVPIPAASAGASNGSGKASLTMTFSDFGTSVHPSPPPASQTADITALLVQQAKASG